MSSALFYNPINAVLTRGLPVPGAKASFYMTGTSTKAIVYSDAAMTIPLSNPVIADGSGLLPATYLNTASTYRVVLADSTGATLPGGDIDPYTPGTVLSLKGDPGGNAMAVGPFNVAAALTIPVGTDKIITTCYANAGDGGGGTYVYDATVDAAFVAAHPRWSVRTANGRGFRLDETQYIWFEMFGAVGDFDHGPAATTNGQGHTFGGTNVPGTDSFPAYTAFKDFQKYFADWPGWDVHYKVVPYIHLRGKAYYSSDTWEFTDTTNLMGEGDGGSGGSASSVIWFAASKPGMIFQSWDTSGTSGSKTQSVTPYDRGASDSHVRGISVYSLGGTLGAAHHGILMRCRMNLEMCSANQFLGHGIYVLADHSAGYKGNANGFRIVRCGATHCGGDGLRVEGSDANAGLIDQFTSFNNLGFGVNEASGLGNKYVMLQTGYNGCFGAGPAVLTPNTYSTFCNYGGNVYRVRPGQEVAARTTTPGTNSAVWVLYASGVTSTLGPTWTTGQSIWVSGGMLWVQGGSNRSTGDGYGETTSEALPWTSDAPNSFGLPGNLGFGNAGLFVINSKVLSNYIGSLNISGGNDYQFTLGGKAGDAASVLARVGFNISGSDAPWTWNVDANNVLSWSYNGGGSTSPINLVGTTTSHPYSVQMPNGATIGTLFYGDAAAMPTTGTYTKGDWIENNNPSISAGKVLKGWKRLTTGSAHVAGTDWTPLYMTTT